jgi:predicted  nucleic acid-binding Zn-ribbon protein
MEQGGDPRDMAREAAKWVVKFQERLADLDQKYEDLIEDLTALRGKLDVRQGRVETAVRDIQEKQIAISNQDNDLVLKEQEVEDALQHIQSSNNVL